MCQRQSSCSTLPSAALIPPCAATVWLRVGNTLVTQAVFNPAATIPSVALSPAPPAPSTITSNEWSTISYALGMRELLVNEKQFENSENARACENHHGCADDQPGRKQPRTRMYIVEKHGPDAGQCMREPGKHKEHHEQRADRGS